MFPWLVPHPVDLFSVSIVIFVNTSQGVHENRSYACIRLWFFSMSDKSERESCSENNNVKFMWYFDPAGKGVSIVFFCVAVHVHIKVYKWVLRVRSRYIFSRYYAGYLDIFIIQLVLAILTDQFANSTILGDMNNVCCTHFHYKTSMKSQGVLSYLPNLCNVMNIEQPVIYKVSYIKVWYGMFTCFMCSYQFIIFIFFRGSLDIDPSEKYKRRWVHLLDFCTPLFLSKAFLCMILTSGKLLLKCLISWPVVQNFTYFLYRYFLTKWCPLYADLYEICFSESWGGEILSYAAGKLMPELMSDKTWTKSELYDLLFLYSLTSIMIVQVISIMFSQMIKLALIWIYADTW